MLRHIKEATLSDRDTEYLNHLWQEETSVAFAEAKNTPRSKPNRENAKTRREGQRNHQPPSLGSSCPQKTVGTSTSGWRNCRKNSNSFRESKN